jgi:adenylate cyclase
MESRLRQSGNRVEVASGENGVAEEKVSRRLAAILAADIAGYSRLMGEDEPATVRALKGHQTLILPLVGEFGGRVIDTAGDGILAEFPSVVAAVECAVKIQGTMAVNNHDVPENRRMRYRIGINLGDVIHDETRIYGDGINVAARLEAIADPEEYAFPRRSTTRSWIRSPFTSATLARCSSRISSGPYACTRWEAGARMQARAPQRRNRNPSPSFRSPT